MEAPWTDWTSLPRDILAYILEKFQTLDEYMLYGRVCKEWCRVMKDHKGWQELSKARAPLLMVPSKDKDRCSLYNVVDKKLCDLEVAMPYEGRFCGSSHGWLAHFEPDHMVIKLNNPFSGRCINLPRIFACPTYLMLEDFPDNQSAWIRKVILSDNPDNSSPENCFVGILYQMEGCLAFMRLSDEAWTYVDPWLTFLCYDMMFRNGYLYVVDDRGKLIRIDSSISSYVDKEEGEVIIPCCFREQAYKVYIVESCRGDMLMIRRFVENPPPHDTDLRLTTRFDIYKLVTSGECSEWVETRSLDDEVIFVGDSQSRSVPCSEFPGCKPNRIYFTDDAYEDGHYDPQGPTDVGVFNVEDGSIEATYPLDHYAWPSMPPPIFMVPKLDDKLFLNRV